jgi:tRNA C32,U32 (ribose-2'-O)-methylase TrmJ
MAYAPWIVATEVTFADLFKGLAGLAILSAALAVIYYNWNKSGRAASKEEIAQWKGLAESRAAKIADLETENRNLVAQLQRTIAERDAAQDEHNECTRQVLKLLARVESHERCINRLEAAHGMVLTNFDDPTIHKTKGFDN